MLDQTSAETFTLVLRVDRNVVDEIRTRFGPTFHVAFDAIAIFNNDGMARSNPCGKVGHHGRRLASDSRNIFDVGGTGD